MQYRRSGNQVLIRVDRDEEILESIRAVCTSEKIYGASFTGIGACGKAIVSSYIPEANDFTNHEASGLLELISLNGNISLENDAPFEHTHALFSYLENGAQKVLAGHLKCAVVSYTAEIFLTVSDTINKVFDPAKSITVWDLFPGCRS